VTSLGRQNGRNRNGRKRNGSYKIEEASQTKILLTFCVRLPRDTFAFGETGDLDRLG
jgi:hypothetical protein